MEKWKPFSKELPTNRVGEQVRVLLMNPDWAICSIGLYEHEPSYSLQKRIAEYNEYLDCFVDIEENLQPTHWLLIPNFSTQ